MVEQNKEKHVVGTVDTCLDHNCTGWLVDSFQGKYVIECLDPRHDAIKKQVERGGQSIIPTKGAHTSVTREVNLGDH